MSILSLKELLMLQGKITETESLALKNNAPFIGCISKIDNVLIDNAEDIDIVMPIYSLIEPCKNYRETAS